MTSLKLVVLGDPAAPHLSGLDRLPPGTGVTVSLDRDKVVAEAPDADVIVNTTGRSELLEAMWPALTRLRWVHSTAAGVENQLFREFVDSDIPLTNSRGVYKESLGEFVVAAALFFAKDLPRMMANRAAHNWEQFDVEMITGRIMGIVGYGEIGAACAQRAKALGMTVHAMRRRPAQPTELVDRWYTGAELLELMRNSDYVVVTAPLTPETRGLIGAEAIAAMKPSAVIMNVGRGPVIDEAALAEALEKKSIRGAAIDVFETEPLPADHPFWKLDNLLLSPHCADHVDGWQESAVAFFVENFSRFVAGEPLKNLVDKRAGY
jgi:phosphoglycerate dehydrogenase-like enzyme